MEFRDLKRQYRLLKPQIDEAIASVLASGSYIMGSAVIELEQRLASYVGVSHCVSCANGTDALRLALEVWGIGEGDAVFVSDFTFFASAEVVASVGATPIFVDVDPHTFNIDVVDLERKLQWVSEHTQLKPRVVEAVDLFGLPANHIAIRSLANRYGMLLLEDGAQGFGGAIGEARACSFGDIATTSFFPAKPLGCYGDGGALFTQNEEWAARARSLRVHGKGDNKYDNVRIGCNSRLDTLQAAVLLAKLAPFVDYELDAVNHVAQCYTQALHDVVVCPSVPQGFYSSWAQYTVVLPNAELRSHVQQCLKASGIPSMVYYPKPLHCQQAFANIEGLRDSCPVATSLCNTVLSLPMHPYMSESEINEVISAVRVALSKMQ